MTFICTKESKGEPISNLAQQTVDEMAIFNTFFFTLAIKKKSHGKKRIA